MGEPRSQEGIPKTEHGGDRDDSMEKASVPARNGRYDTESQEKVS